MRRIPTTLMFGRRLIGPVLAALMLLTVLGLMLPSRADAQIRLGVRLSIPHVDVVIRTGTDGHAVRTCQVPVRRVTVLDRGDRLTALRLARETRYGQDVFLDLRRAGYDWYEIGRILDLPRRMIVAAVYAGDDGHRDWNRGNHYGNDRGRDHDGNRGGGRILVAGRAAMGGR